MSDHQFQLDIERLFNNNQLIPRIKRWFVEANFGAYMDLKGIPQKFGYSLLAQMVLHKRATVETLVGCLRHEFLDEQNPSQACADMLYTAADADLMNFNPSLDKFIIVWDVPQDVRDDIDRYQYPMPMVIEPREIRNNSETGYLTIRDSVILKNNHHEDDVCLDHLNRMNKIKLTINHDVAQMVKNRWKGLDKPKDDEAFEDYEQRVKQFKKYDRTAKDVHEHLELAGGVFHLTHRYDKRGRCYSQGYHVNYQGTPWNKAVIEMFTQEVAT